MDWILTKASSCTLFNQKSVCLNLLIDITIQKGGSSNVAHIVDLKNIPFAQKNSFQKNVIKGATNSTGIILINNNTE